MEVKINSFDKQMPQIHSSLTAFNEQIAEVQTRMSATNDNIVDTDKKITGLLKTVEVVETKVEYLENKSRQSNLLIFAVLKGAEKNDRLAFAHHLLPKILGQDIQEDSPLQTERVHHISTPNTS